jgi:hypothetical protein
MREADSDGWFNDYRRIGGINSRGARRADRGSGVTRLYESDQPGIEAGRLGHRLANFR